MSNQEDFELVKRAAAAAERAYGVSIDPSKVKVTQFDKAVFLAKQRGIMFRAPCPLCGRVPDEFVIMTFPVGLDGHSDWQVCADREACEDQVRAREFQRSVEDTSPDSSRRRPFLMMNPPIKVSIQSPKGDQP